MVMNRFTGCLLAIVGLMSLSPRSFVAQSTDDSKDNGVVTLNSLVDELLAKNPELQAVRKRYEAALTRPYQDIALPDPRITAGWNLALRGSIIDWQHWPFSTETEHDGADAE